MPLPPTQHPGALAPSAVVLAHVKVNERKTLHTEEPLDASGAPKHRSQRVLQVAISSSGGMTANPTERLSIHEIVLPHQCRISRAEIGKSHQRVIHADG